MMPVGPTFLGRASLRRRPSTNQPLPPASSATCAVSFELKVQNERVLFKVISGSGLGIKVRRRSVDRSGPLHAKISLPVGPPKWECAGKIENAPLVDQIAQHFPRCSISRKTRGMFFSQFYFYTDLKLAIYCKLDFNYQIRLKCGKIIAGKK